MMNRICCHVIVIVFMLGSAPFMERAFSQVSDNQSAIKPQKPKQDWVSSMPVSLNGKISDSLPSGWTNRYWHSTLYGKLAVRQWNATEFFDDPLVVSLCEAIYDKDVPEMERLIAAGADVNCVGEDGMNLLYWAFHVDDDPRPFGCLLKHGANPNVIVNLDRERGLQSLDIGYAVSHLVAQGVYNRHFKNVFENGGDPNMKNKVPFSGLSPFWMIRPSGPDAAERVQLLIKNGAELNTRDEHGQTIPSYGVRGGEDKRRLVLIVLKAGADYRLYYKQNGSYYRLIHYLAEAEPTVNERPASEQTHYRAVVAWLEEHGESFAEAKADLQRWERWKQNGDTDLIEKEHEARLAKEADKSLRTPCAL